ncbi:acyl-CoA dehydrogenase, C-terminal domain protein [Mycobacterium xenopi 3993]|nr:acyl-CoA dehydrogenase, C-terminal domain protein [Mycobacterium xenopi 3993]
MTSGAKLPEWRGSRLTGTLPLVAGAPAAELLLVLAEETDSNNPVVVAVDPSDDAVDVVAHQPFDLTSTIGSVTLHRASGELLAVGSAVCGALEASRPRALLAVAADSVGVGSRALAMAVAWAGEREQFGRPIGSFQAISHRCADMLVALEGARSQVLAAADELDATGSDRAVDLAAAAAFDAAVAAGEGVIQIHGGVGFTWEHPAHLLLRRARANAVLVGRAEALRDRAARDVVAAARKEATAL